MASSIRSMSSRRPATTSRSRVSRGVWRRGAFSVGPWSGLHDTDTIAAAQLEQSSMLRPTQDGTADTSSDAPQHPERACRQHHQIFVHRRLAEGFEA